MEETLFFILGIGLTVLAVLVAAVGLRFESFPPSKPVLAAGTALFAVLVLATMTFAWLNGEEEQDHRNAEIAAGHELSPQEGLALLAEGEEGAEAPAEEAAPPAEEPAAGEPEPPAPSEEQPAGGDPAASAADGALLFADNGCGGCHTLADAGTSGTTGPNLDGALANQDAASIETSIVDPNETIAEGFPPDVMPQTFGTQLSPEDLAALVAYLLEATSGN